MENTTNVVEQKPVVAEVTAPAVALNVEKKRMGRPRLDKTNVVSKSEERRQVVTGKIVTGNKTVLFNTLGEEVPVEDYFYKGVVSAGFESTCGKPVDREDLVTVFNKVFKPADSILFYRQLDKEVYLVIVPIKYATTVGESNNSVDGDFQKHAISFLNEGSVNLDTMRQKLEKVNKFVKYSDR